MRTLLLLCLLVAACAPAPPMGVAEYDEHEQAEGYARARSLGVARSQRGQKYAAKKNELLSGVVRGAARVLWSRRRDLCSPKRSARECQNDHAHWAQVVAG